MEQRYRAVFSLAAVRFAPFLAAGAVIALLVGNQVVTAYLSLF